MIRISDVGSRRYRLRYTVLLLHDDQRFVGALRERLNRDGRVEFLTVDNAFEAGRLTRQRLPKLILFNAHLPELNVFDAVEKVRLHTPLQRVRVLCLADFDERLTSELLARGADEVLSLKCETIVLVSAIYRHLGLQPWHKGENGAMAR